MGAVVLELPTVDCEEPHTHEIYHAEDYAESPPTDVYPGFDALEDYARILCLEHFEDYVGNNPFDSVLFYSWLVPTLDSWNDSDKKDREIICLVGEQDGSDLDGPVRDSGR